MHFMQKKLLAIAVAGALAPAAAMAQSTVEIYGRANLGIDNFRATGATIDANSLKGRMRVFDASSRVGFRVNESLGGGMRAFVVVETGVNIDTGNNVGQAAVSGTNGSSGFWASRASYVGLGGGWGDVRFGRQDVWYGNGIIMQASSNYLNTGVDGVWTHFGALAAPGGRTSNVLSYNSPTVGGFNASLYWAPAAGGEGAAFTGGDQEQEARWGVTARYTAGPIRAQVDWAQDKAVGNVDEAKNKGFKAGIGFAYAPDSQVSVMTGSVSNERPTFTDELKQRVTVLNWEHMFGQLQVIAQYMFTGDVKGTVGGDEDTRTKGITLAGKYFLSKRTGVYLSYNKYTNEDRAFMDFGPGACLSSAAACHLSAAQAGADPQIIALGIMHNF
jgi:predicted porin